LSVSIGFITIFNHFLYSLIAKCRNIPNRSFSFFYIVSPFPTVFILIWPCSSLGMCYWNTLVGAVMLFFFPVFFSRFSQSLAKCYVCLLWWVFFFVHTQRMPILVSETTRIEQRNSSEDEKRWHVFISFTVSLVSYVMYSSLSTIEVEKCKCFPYLLHPTLCKS
jgi:hypothetical protein